MNNFGVKEIALKMAFTKIFFQIRERYLFRDSRFYFSNFFEIICFQKNFSKSYILFEKLSK